MHSYKNAPFHSSIVLISLLSLAQLLRILKTLTGPPNAPSVAVHHLSGPIVYRLGHQVFILVSAVRFRVGSHWKKSHIWLFFCFIDYISIRVVNKKNRLFFNSLLLAIPILILIIPTMMSASFKAIGQIGHGVADHCWNDPTI